MKNSVLSGFLLGLIFPIIAFVLTRYTEAVATLFPDKPTGLYIIAAAFNLIACYFCYKKDLDKTGNGFVLTTFLGMLLMIFTKNILITAN
ncbi:hypothetical protein ACP6L2_13510 [Sphingobacterium lactis]|uniref:hypothetical protein n=1 Tax=Sphingobacterium lactis TaxID=797291 RepID=UPI003F81980F